jgi:hypothetical protein
MVKPFTINTRLSLRALIEPTSGLPFLTGAVTRSFLFLSATDLACTCVHAGRAFFAA